jgi:hypothetical protein
VVGLAPPFERGPGLSSPSPHIPRRPGPITQKRPTWPTGCYPSPTTVMTSPQSRHWKTVSFGRARNLGMTRATFIFPPQRGHEGKIGSSANIGQIMKEADHAGDLLLSIHLAMTISRVCKTSNPSLGPTSMRSNAGYRKPLKPKSDGDLLSIRKIKP